MNLLKNKKMYALVVAATMLSFAGANTFFQINPPVAQSNEDPLHSLHLFCHEAFDPVVCIQGGRAYESGNGGPSSVKRAIDMFGVACRVDILGCTLQGAAIYNNSKTAEERAKAFKPWTKACGADNGRACNGLGHLYEEDGLGAANLVKAFRLFEKACSLSWPAGCFNLGYAHEYGRGVEKSLVKAALNYETACKGGFGQACLYAGFSYLDGEGVEKSVKTSTAYFGKGCDVGNLDACHNFGNSLQTGTGIGEDATRAVGVWQSACDAKHSSSCFRLAKSYALGMGVSQDMKKAAIIGELACRPDSSEWRNACHNLGHSYWDDQTLGFAKDFTKALKIMEKICAAGDKDACHHVEDLKANKEKPRLNNP